MDDQPVPAAALGRRVTRCDRARFARPRSLYQGLDQPIPGEFGRFGRDAPAESPGRLGSDRADARQANLVSHPPASRFRQQAVQAGYNRRAGERNPVDGSGLDPFQHIFGQRFGVGIVIDGNLVDIGQLLKLFPEDGSSAIGAGQ